MTECLGQNISKGENNTRKKILGTYIYKDVGVKQYTNSNFVHAVASIFTVSPKGCVTPVNKNSVASELHSNYIF